MMRAALIAFTHFDADKAKSITGWETDEQGGQALAEFAGRSCYQSWSKPNPETAFNADYLANILKQGHFSVLEHATATFYIQGVSRSLTHELIRHRHFSYSELSQRFVNVEEAEGVIPPAVQDGDATTEKVLSGALESAQGTYKALVDGFLLQGYARKQAREAARAVMPNMTETKIVVTGNMRAWRHFLEMRGSLHADAEIRRLAVEIGWQLKQHAPNFFPDLHLKVGDSGDSLYFGEHL